MYVGAVISDIHIGAVPARDLRTQLFTRFIPRIRKMEKLDAIVVSGDLFDRKLSFNDEHSKLAIDFVDAVLKISRKKKAKVRILRGTRNHDLNQLNNFLYLEGNPNWDFRIINTVSDEQLFPDLKVLYVPEEYMEDKTAYYADHLSGQYDLCFGHGTFAHAGFAHGAQESERPMKGAPVFDYEEFKDVVRGPVFFGHIHNRSVYRDKIYYCGSFSRWAFGEEDPKGFYTFSYSPESGRSKVAFIENTLAPAYVTLDVNELIRDKSKTVEEKIRAIEAAKADKGIAKLRVKFDKHDVSEDAEVAMIRGYFSEKGKDVKVNVTNLKRAREDEEETTLEEEYAFIFKKEYPMDKIVSEYLRKRHNIIITPDAVSSILSTSNNALSEGDD